MFMQLYHTSSQILLLLGMGKVVTTSMDAALKSDWPITRPKHFYLMRRTTSSTQVWVGEHRKVVLRGKVLNNRVLVFFSYLNIFMYYTKKESLLHCHICKYTTEHREKNHPSLVWTLEAN